MWLTLLSVLFFGFTSAWATSIDLGGVITGNRMAAVPLGRTVSKGVVDVEGVCTKAGVACQNCTHSVTCIQLPGGWLKVPLEACSGNLTCNAHEGKCSTNPVPECDVETKNFEHICEQVGIFPDAYDCRKFHLCSPDQGLPDGRPADHRTALCPRHYGYNPGTAQCSIKLNNGQCEQRPVSGCIELGQMDVLSSSSNYYYLCLTRNNNLYPQIFICPNGWYFWDGFCHPEQMSVNVESTTTREVSKHISINTKVHIGRTRTDLFFSTESPTTNQADTFLADKFDLTNYESTDDVQRQSNDEFSNSFESQEFF